MADEKRLPSGTVSVLTPEQVRELCRPHRSDEPLPVFIHVSDVLKDGVNTRTFAMFKDEEQARKYAADTLKWWLADGCKS